MTVFLDSNVLIYALEDDPDRAGTANALIDHGARISVQVLNEVANVLRLKLRRDWIMLGAAVGAFRSSLSVLPLTVQVHERGLYIAERYRNATGSRPTAR